MSTPETIDAEIEVPERQEEKPKSELAVIPRNEQELAAMEKEVEMIGRMAEISRKRTEQILKLGYKGDFVAFGNEGKQKVSISTAFALRVAPKLGIEIVDVEKEMIRHKDDRGEWVQFTYSARAIYRGMAFPIQSQADTRMKFFAVVDGVLKPLAEVKMPDVQTAAYRGLYKEACKVCLGLHQLPYDVVVAVLGADAISGYNFQSGQRSSSTAAAPTDQKMDCPDCGKPMKLRNKKDGSGKFWGCSGYPDCKKIVGYKDQPATQAPPPDDMAVQDETWNMVLDMVDNDPAKAKTELKVKYACLDLEKATGKTLTDVFNKVKADHIAWKGEK